MIDYCDENWNDDEKDFWNVVWIWNKNVWLDIGFNILKSIIFIRILV